MPILVALRHVTRYRYDRPVALGPHDIRLRPADRARARIARYALRIDPADHSVGWHADANGNWLARAVFPARTRELRIAVDLDLEMAPANPFDFLVEPWAATRPLLYPDRLRAELAPCLASDEDGPGLDAFMAELPEEPDTVRFVVALNALVHARIGYIVRMEPGVQTPDETLALGTGSCRDSAWLMVQALRRAGYAARFVSGYLVQLATGGADGVEADRADLHAWAEVYLPGAGWIGLDATSGLLCAEGHVPLAAAPHYASAAPVEGAAEPAEVDFDVEMRVERIAGTPRPVEATGDVADLDALGEAVDRDLRAGDVRLTMGGEPTFVALDGACEPEWTVAALGPTKHGLADRFARRLRERFAPGAALHHGQGKWYPGEDRPRWAIGLHWRRDGVPAWRDAALLASDEGPRDAGIGEAEALAAAIAERLGLVGYARPALEDPVAWLGREAALPVGIAPDDPRLADPAGRADLVRVLQGGLGTPAAFVLPLYRLEEEDGRRWVSEHWETRRGALYLLPGALPAGARLPLASLPPVPPEHYPYLHPRDPTEELGPLAEAGRAEPGRPPARTVAVRTALMVEPREGILHVFLPPTEQAEDWLDLVRVVEEAAAAAGRPVRLDGYGPPADPRLDGLKVTPDPGVIEVNVQAAADWREAAAITRGVYAEAAALRLGAERFAADGRRLGTGGGSHVVMGGTVPADSPFLRRPDLLRSLVLYWQRHPALSYLFSGLYIGPTSQAPRLDEARHDALYELEIAMAQVPGPDGGPIPLWLVDRLFRNLLVDVAGNTHRAEICVDKLYSPDGTTGRLGLVEFRAFEMAPDPDASLARQLLLRAIVARLWRAPVEGRFVRWGTTLHDRFMLPHALWEDLLGVLADLRDAGYRFDPAWFASGRDFRFPVHGTIRHEGVGLTLREALEPWHVLGEEGSGGGTVRLVDSSIRRLEIKADGFVAGRHVVACNGRRLPMTPTGIAGEAIAGVRFKAWKPATGLHPTLPVHAPLRIDILDAWTSRRLGGCIWYAGHPAGLGYPGLPVDAAEAAARCAARFVADVGGPGDAPIPPEESHPDFPLTLDLRRPPP